MITEQQLEAFFADRSLLRVGERYFDLPTSSDFIEACIENDFAIIGIEGFEMVEGGIRPRMDLIADFSERDALTWSNLKDRANRSALAFRNAVTDHAVLLNFTVVNRTEWERSG
ncbi:MAG: hypothetical protein Q8N23_28075 [Archangium sp.]|nr:hypothetical protein [Archangium sp.]MDP3576337.1 hypothetical protein [Archangium sp.]